MVPMRGGRPCLCSVLSIHAVVTLEDQLERKRNDHRRIVGTTHAQTRRHEQHPSASRARHTDLVHFMVQNAFTHSRPNDPSDKVMKIGQATAAAAAAAAEWADWKENKKKKSKHELLSWMMYQTDLSGNYMLRGRWSCFVVLVLFLVFCAPTSSSLSSTRPRRRCYAHCAFSFIFFSFRFVRRFKQITRMTDGFHCPQTATMIATATLNGCQQPTQWRRCTGTPKH